MNKCKHEIGWLLVGRKHLFVDKKGSAHIGFKHKSLSGGTRLLFQCNNVDCKAVRNIYLKTEVVLFGKVRMVSR